MENQPGTLYDGFGSLDGGVNGQANHDVVSPVNTNGLTRNQCANAINCTFRGGIGATHRPPVIKHTLQFPDSETANAFMLGRYQGHTVHQANPSSILVSIGGHLYQVRVSDNFKVFDLTDPEDPNPDNRDMIFTCQAGPFTIIDDGQSPTWIFDGTTLRRARNNEKRPGGPCAYVQGRIVYALLDQYGLYTRFRATDLIGVTTNGTAQYNYQDSVLRETENDFLNSGGDFTSRSDMGEIRAMIVPRMLDTSLGQGPLQLMCERGSLSFNAPVDRDQWKSVTYPIETESQMDYGPKGPRQACNVNGDILYRSTEGYHSFKMARDDFQSTWVNAPISSEVDNVILEDPEPYLPWGSTVFFDSRFLATTFPRPTPSGFVHDGLVAMDMNLVTNLRKRDQPAWEGLWTGLAILGIGKGTFDEVERCFIFARNTSGFIELWELLPSETTVIHDNGNVPIVWSFETPAYDFNDGTALKRLITAAYFTADVQDTVEYLVQWRPDQYPCWLDWHAWSDCAPIRQCNLGRCGVPKNLKPQYRPKVKLPQPPDLWHQTNKEPANLRDGFTLALRTQVTGHTSVRKVKIAADHRPESLFDSCPDVGPCLPLDCCSPDPMQYSSAPYQPSGPGGNPTYAGYPPVYPYVFYPTPPHDYPVPTEPAPDTPVTNPPPVTPEPVTPGTVIFPGLPPVVLLPDPNATPLVGTGEFDGTWTRMDTGEYHDVGVVTEDQLWNLQDGTLADWSTGLWVQFSDYVIANGLTILSAQIQPVNTGGGIGPGAYKKWMADALFRESDYFAIYGLGWSLVIVYNTA